VLSGVVSANSAYRLTYVHSVFSDEEIENMLEVGGSVNGAAIQAIETLMFDAIKRSEWESPDGTEYNDTMAMGHLRSMYTKLKDNLDQEVLAGGTIASWSLTQGDYS
jgi:hypothetical protein